MAKKRRRRKIVNEKTLVVTVDIGKNESYGYCRTLGGEDIRAFPVPTTKEGFENFWNRVVQFKEQHGSERTVFGFESTASFAEPITHFMNARGVELVQVDPMNTKRSKYFGDNSPEKSDQKDPEVIATLVCLNAALSVIIPEGFEAELRRLTQGREHFTRLRNMLVNRVYDRLSIIFPELGCMLKLETKSAEWLLTNYITPAEMVAAGAAVIKEGLRKVSRGKLKPEKIDMIWRAAESSVGVTAGCNSIRLEIKQNMALIGLINDSIRSLELEMSAVLRQIPSYKNLRTVKGIGVVTAAAIIGEIGDIKKFRSVGDVVKLAGLNLFSLKSGKHAGRLHITKKGRQLLRKYLFLAVQGMVRKDGIFYDEYQRLLKGGRCKMVALVILMRKLLRIIFALMRDQVDYRPNQNAAAA